jgi:hypothetical protein
MNTPAPSATPRRFVLSSRTHPAQHPGALFSPHEHTQRNTPGALKDDAAAATRGLMHASRNAPGLARLVVAVQVECESKFWKPGYHISGSRVETRCGASSYGSTAFNLYSPTSLLNTSCPPMAAWRATRDSDASPSHKVTHRTQFVSSCQHRTHKPFLFSCQALFFLFSTLLGQDL